jgi:hypothetical protein
MADGLQQRFEVCRLALEQSAQVRARRRPGAPERDDVADLGQREPKPSPVGDEGQHTQDLGGIDPVAGGGALRRRQDPARLVQA